MPSWLTVSVKWITKIALKFKMKLHRNFFLGSTTHIFEKAGFQHYLYMISPQLRIPAANSLLRTKPCRTEFHGRVPLTLGIE